MSFKEQRELETIERAIQELESKITETEKRFESPNFHREHGPRAAEIIEHLSDNKKRLEIMLERWGELEALRSLSTNPESD